MNRRLRTIFVIAGVGLVIENNAVEAGQSPALATAVAQHYPQLLVDEALEIDGDDPPRKQCFAVLESLPTGAPKVVVAGYTNLISGAVRLLQASGAGFEVAAAPDFGYVTGWGCEAEAIDLNNDGRKEAVVRFITGDSSVDWVFKWDGQQFQSIAPTTTNPVGLVNTSLLNTLFVDVDGDNVMELFTSSALPREGQPLPGRMYRLSGASYVLDRSIVGMRTFARSAGSPQTDVETIALPAGAIGPFTLRIVNGAGAAGGNGNKVEDAVESGRVWWNGQQIVGPNNFGNHVAVIERTVTMQTTNELQVRLAGSPGGRIVIVIDAASWTP